MDHWAIKLKSWGTAPFKISAKLLDVIWAKSVVTKRVWLNPYSKAGRTNRTIFFVAVAYITYHSIRKLQKDYENFMIHEGKRLIAKEALKKIDAK